MDLKRPSGPTLAAIALAGAALLFVVGAVLADVLRDETDSEVATTPTTTTTGVETVTVDPLPGSGVGGGATGLPDAYVATRYRDSPIVFPTGVFTKLVHLELGRGSYQVFGRVSLHSRDPQTPFRVSCALVPSNRDGTPPSSWSELGSDVGHEYLAPFDTPGQEADLTLIVSQELDSRGRVVLGCLGEDDANEHGAFASLSIHAVEVGSIATTEG